MEDALLQLATGTVDAAIIDADVAGVSAIAARLASQRIPFVVQAGTSLNVGLRSLCDQFATLFRPVDPKLVVTLLAVEIEKAHCGDPWRRRHRQNRTELPLPLRA